MADHLTPNERRFLALAHSSDDRVAEVDARGRVRYASPNHDAAGERVVGLGSVHPDDRAAVAARFIDAFRHGTTARVSFRVLEGRGPARSVDCTLTPFASESGERHVLVVSRDVTEAREIERQLRESRERFQLIAENAYDMIVEYDSAWKLQYANDRVQSVLRLADTNFDPNLDLRYFHPDDQERVTEILESLRSGRQESAESTYRVIRADGSWCWLDASFRIYPAGDGTRHCLIIARDVTERVATEQRLRESEQRYRELVESAPLGIFVIQNGAIAFTNAAGATLCGARSPAELSGRTVLDLLDQRGLHAIRESLERSKGSEPRSGSFAVHLVGLDGQERHLTTVWTIRSYGGAPAFQCIVSDVTELERARREQERLALQLQEARKLESLGVLAGGIAHDFNNLLAVILSSVRYAQSPDTSREDLAEALADAEEATDSAARLVKQLLAYAGRRSPEVRSIDVSELARSLSDLLSTALPRSVELRLDLEPEPLVVHADLVQVEQVLMNLVLNAADAVGEGPGTVTVRTRHATFERGDLAGWIAGDGLAAGSYACLEVEDSGRGMDAATQARIFEPFFSTKQNGHGLGLSAVLGLVQGHRGAIEVRSEPGVGTRFRVALPAGPAPLDARIRAGAPLVLVAERDPDVRQAAVAELRAAGIRTLEAHDAPSAFDCWAIHAEELDAAVLDLGLDTAGAGSLAEKLRADRPELPILGLCADGESARGGDPSLAVLRKPLASGALADAIAGLLGKAPE